MLSKNEEFALKKKQGCLVFDIETSSFDIEGKPINIKHDFNNYVTHAKVKWLGAYSYKDDEFYLLNAITQKSEILELLARHNTLVGFNNIQFDTPITKNNGLLPNYVKELDVQIILGTNVKYGQKNRASYMRVKLKPVVINGKKHGANSLMSMAYHFGLETLKGDIDYKIFFKDEWTESETEEIKKYLYQDVKITKELFDRAFDFYIVFADFLTLQDVDKWQWLKSSIASMTYSSACKVKECEVNFGERGDDDDMGGRAIVPPQEETFGAYDVDEASKYPHTFAEFNLCSEVDITNKDPIAVQKAIKEGKLFHGNEKFKVRGYYDIREQGVLEKDIIKKLKMRFAIKEVLKTYKKDSIRELVTVDESISHLIPNNFLSDEVLKKLSGLEYALKILLNSKYGAIRSSVFANIYTKNAGHDCCDIGQQIHEYVQLYLEERGFKLVGGFTDSWFIEGREGYSNDDVTRIVNECLNELKKYMPFPADTHVIAFERYMDYLLYHYDKNKQEFKKNNYAYISDGKVELVGFPIMKDNATKVSMLVFNKYLREEGIKNKRLKFDKNVVMKHVREELEKDITLASVTYKVDKADVYKNANQLQAQISRAYLYGQAGVVEVIKNTKVGKVGKGNKYCTIEEAKKYNLQVDDLVLTKVENELDPFLLPEKVATLDDW